MDTNKPSFKERIAALKACAHELHDMGATGRFDLDLIGQAADIMLTEAQHMEAAGKRFSERKGNGYFRKYRTAEAAR